MARKGKTRPKTYSIEYSDKKTTADNSKVIVEKHMALSYLESPAVKVRVGTDDNIKSFDIHKDLLVSRSPFFENAFKDETKWLEKDNVVELPVDDPSIFASYVQLLYAGRIPLSGMKTSADHEYGEGGFEKGKQMDEYESDDDLRARSQEWIVSRMFDKLSKLYILCEKLQDVQGKNLILSAFLEATRTDGKLFLPHGSHVTCIYDGTPENDPLRRLVVDLFTRQGEYEMINDDREGFPSDFYHDLAVAALKQRPKPYDHFPIDVTPYVI